MLTLLLFAIHNSAAVLFAVHVLLLVVVQDSPMGAETKPITVSCLKAGILCPKLSQVLLIPSGRFRVFSFGFMKL